MKTCFTAFISLLLFSGVAYAEVSFTGQSGSINVPTAFIKKGGANIALYNTYSSQKNMLGAGSKLENDTVYGAISYAPLEYLEVSLGSTNSSSDVNSQNLHYSGDLRIGIKGSREFMPHLSIGALAEALLYSKVTNSGNSAGYNGHATGYTLSLLASYDMSNSGLSFPMIANLRIGYLWDNTQHLIPSNDNNLLPPVGKYAMGIRGDNLTLMGISVLFPLPKYYIEPMIEFTSQFAGKYSSYALTDPSYSSVTFSENPMYITPGILFFTPVKGLRIAAAVELSLSKKLSQSTGGPAYITPQAVWVVGLSYSFI